MKLQCASSFGQFFQVPEQNLVQNHFATAGSIELDGHLFRKNWFLSNSWNYAMY